jgi:hypothetical protein
MTLTSCIKWLRLAAGALPLACLAPASAELLAISEPAPSLPFTATLSNNLPLAFGMDVTDVSRVLRQPLRYINGRPGDETYLAFRNIGGSGLFPQRHRLYLLFRHGKLAGWKGDWGHNWMWQ